MPSVGIIDDREDSRKNLVASFDLYLEAHNISQWEIIDTPPKTDIEEYITWINQHKICSLIMDEKLAEGSSEGNIVSYEGHDLVVFFRQRFPTLPIFIITSYPEDEPINEKFKDVESIIARVDFSRNSDNYVPRILRSSQKYLETFQEEFVILSDVATKIAIGQEVSLEEEAKAKAIQQKMEIAFDLDKIQTRQEWLGDFENLINEMKELKSQMEQYLESKK